MSNNAKTINPCKVITGKDTRWSYANVWEPKAINGGTPKYSVSLIIPKSDTVTVAKIKAAIEAAYQEGDTAAARKPVAPAAVTGRLVVVIPLPVGHSRSLGTLILVVR